MRSPSRTYTWDTRPMIFAANSARWAAATTPVLWPVSLTGWRATVKTATASAGLSDSALATARWLLSLHPRMTTKITAKATSPTRRFDLHISLLLRVAGLNLIALLAPALDPAVERGGV